MAVATDRGVRILISLYLRITVVCDLFLTIRDQPF